MRTDILKEKIVDEKDLELLALLPQR